MSEKKSTKDRILEVSLALFSEKGYDATSVDQIGEMAGIKGPAIYNHFKGKEGILDALIEVGNEYYLNGIGKGANQKNTTITVNTLVQISLKQLEYTMHDETVIRFRKLFSIEQFRDERFSELATKYFVTTLETMYTNIFRAMMQAGTLKEDDPGLLAMEYIFPVSMMIAMVDRQPEKEPEAMEKIRKHLEHFAKVYGAERRETF